MDASLRDLPLPDFRQHLASDRTLLAWVRTAISLAGLGFVVTRFGLFLRQREPTHQVEESRMSLIIGVTLIGLSAVVIIVGIAQYRCIVRALAQHYQLSPGPRWPAPTAAIACVTAIISLALYLCFASEVESNAPERRPSAGAATMLGQRRGGDCLIVAPRISANTECLYYRYNR